MKAHLFTCLTTEEVHNFIENGFIGLGPFYPTQNATNRQIGARLRILWDVIADLKRVEIGDLCFLHSEGQIYGPFIFGSVFYESETLPELLTSNNLRLNVWIANSNNFADLEINGYGYVASINQPIGCNITGAKLMEVFLRQSYGIFNGIPPRFMYGDTKKILKPLLKHEIPQLLEILNYNNNFDVQVESNFQTTNLHPIELDLSSYNGKVFSEKILEGWLIEQMSRPNNQNITNHIGNYNYYANSIYTYYTNFLDIITYNTNDNYNLNFCEFCNGLIRNSANDISIIELKRDSLTNELNAIHQVRTYMKWARNVLNPHTEIYGYIVANGFNQNYINFVRENEEDNITLITYTINENGIQLVNAIDE